MVGHVGLCILSVIRTSGAVVCFFFKCSTKGLLPPVYFRQIFKQAIDIGLMSVAIISFTALFTGMVLALQTYTAFSRFGGDQSVADVVALSIVRELGPVLSGLMISGRIGSSIAAEIATMRVTEQIDALHTLSTDPIKYLVFPRIFCGVTLMPFLTVIADVIGISGGCAVSVYKFHSEATSYIGETFQTVALSDITAGIIKSVCFGLIVTLMGCYHGYNASKGARGVGTATTNSVVSSSILILIFNYVLTAILF